MSNNKGNRIYVAGGSKGGVGKSMLTSALIDMLQEAGKAITLVETDTSNPDTFKMHQGQINCVTLDLDDAGGWVELVNIADARRGDTLVINTAARNNKGVSKFGVTLQSTLPELDRELVTFWVINRQRDSLELLREYQQSITKGSLHVVMNEYFGTADKFELWNNSRLRQEIDARGGQSVLLPDLADRVSDDLYSQRLSIARAMIELPLGNRAELARWRSEVRKSLGAVVS